ncbi:hypothetical protein [Streptomyces sp. NPDC006668]|uniref:hypothetical protein n=1 Tax=Streptomyces sp. NPDC006668 TaxID=3156903 RepID=UPI0033E81859
MRVGPPDGDGGRLVCIHGVPIGRAYGLWDMIIFLQRGGLDLGEEDEIAVSPLIEWTGPGPLAWEH